MDVSLEEPIPHHLKIMSLATTPQQAFESADRMLVQAATIRECAEELQERVRSLYAKAEEVEEAAYGTQRQGMQDREEISEVLDNMMKQYTHILPQFQVVKPEVIPKIVLAVEEGRALVQEVDAVGALLHRYANTLFDATDASAGTESEVDRISVDQPAEPKITELFENVISTEAIHSHVNPNVVDGKQNEDKSSAQKIENQFVVPDSTDEEYYPAEAIVSTDTQAETANRKLTPRRPSKAIEYQLNDDEEMPVSDRKKKPRVNREYRRKRMLSDMGYDDVEISDIDLSKIKSSKSKGAKKRSRNRNKKTKLISGKLEAHASDDG